MRYRMELETAGSLAVRNVEADLVVGRVQPCTTANPTNPDVSLLDACSVSDSEGHDLGYIKVKKGRDVLKQALSLVAFDKWDRGYPSMRPAGQRPDPCRVEFRLGEVIAEVVAAMASAMSLYREGGLTAETTERIGHLLAELHDIWCAGRIGSFNGETFADEPYFRNTNPQGPRMEFGGAARHWGFDEMYSRFPEASDETLQELAEGVLEFIANMLNLSYRSKLTPQA